MDVWHSSLQYVTWQRCMIRLYMTLPTCSVSAVHDCVIRVLSHGSDWPFLGVVLRHQRARRHILPLDIPTPEHKQHNLRTMFRSHRMRPLSVR